MLHLLHQIHSGGILLSRFQLLPFLFHLVFRQYTIAHISIYNFRVTILTYCTVHDSISIVLVTFQRPDLKLHAAPDLVTR